MTEVLAYSYIAERQQVDDQPLFQGVQGPSMVMDLSQGSDLFNAVDVLDQKDFFVFADNYTTINMCFCPDPGALEKVFF